MSDTIRGDFAHDSDGKPVYFAPTTDPSTPPAWTWWKRDDGAMWFISENGEFRYRNAEGIEREGWLATDYLDAWHGRQPPETCPARPRPTTDVPVGTVWRGKIVPDCLWKLKPDGTLDYSTDGGLTWGAPNVCSVADLETDKKSVERLPLGTKPTTDAASRAIAAHTTPGKTGEDSPTTPTPEEVWAIIDAVPRGSAHVALAMERYGLRVYHNGAEFAIRSMTNG